MSADVLLLGCVGPKLAHAAPARDLYRSPYFRSKRDYADASGKPWFILSALHGLVAPDSIIEPYDLSLEWLPIPERVTWGERSVASLESVLGGLSGLTVEIHAGRTYRTWVGKPLVGRGALVTRPPGGRGIADLRAWYRSQIAVSPRDWQAARRRRGVAAAESANPSGLCPVGDFDA